MTNTLLGTTTLNTTLNKTMSRDKRTAWHDYSKYHPEENKSSKQAYYLALYPVGDSVKFGYACTPV